MALVLTCAIDSGSTIHTTAKRVCARRHQQQGINTDRCDSCCLLAANTASDPVSLAFIKSGYCCQTAPTDCNILLMCAATTLSSTFNDCLIFLHVVDLAGESMSPHTGLAMASASPWCSFCLFVGVLHMTFLNRIFLNLLITGDSFFAGTTSFSQHTTFSTSSVRLLLAC